MDRETERQRERALEPGERRARGGSLSLSPHSRYVVFVVYALVLELLPPPLRAY